MVAKQKDKVLFVSIILLVILHLAGLIGIFVSHKNFFLSLTPFNLIASSCIVFVNHKDFSRQFFIFCLITFLFTFFIEVIGVQSGIIFGEYNYGNLLGEKIFEVPIIIGINWLTLIYCAGSICNNLPTNYFIKSIAASALLVFLDLFIEPVATKCNFWIWKNNLIPLQNYIVWFLISFTLLLFFNAQNFNKTNGVAKYLFGIQFLFFVILSFFLKS